MSALTIDGSTRLYGIVGDPIYQVKTPQLMNAYFQQQSINAVCVPLQVATATCEASLRGIMALGNIAGLVITVPHKIRACALADALSAQARQVMARLAGQSPYRGGVGKGRRRRLRFLSGVYHPRRHSLLGYRRPRPGHARGAL